MIDLLNNVVQASVWLAVTVLLLAGLRPLLLRLGGAALAYRGWWLLPLVLGALCLPLPTAPLADSAPMLAIGAVLSAPVVPAATSLWPSLLLGAWLMGAVAMAVTGWRAQRRFEHALGPLRPRADGSWQASADPGLPALVGLWQPRIVVGPTFEQDFSPAEQDLILSHERSHRRHGDPWANAALALLRCVFWFHPLLPWAARRFLRDQELACDARTVDPRPALRRLYANALLKAQLVHPVAPMTCHWRSQPMLKERIAMLKEHKRKALPWLTGQVLVVGLCVGMATVAWAGQVSGVAAASGMGHAVVVADRGATAHMMPPPSYPKIAFEQRIGGKVMLRVDVDSEGRATNVRVLEATPAGVFDDVTVAAAKQWTFEPAIKDGKAVASALKIPVTFAMDDDEPAG